MREIIARIVCLVTVLAIVLLAFQFAVVHNPPPPPATTPVAGDIARVESPSQPAEGSPGAVSRGRAVYEELRCATCHSIGGEGNPRHPLDGVAGRIPAAELPMWIEGTGRAAEVLSAGTLRRKQAFQSIAVADREALVQFLVSLPPRPPK